MYSEKRHEAYPIVWDEPSVGDSTWQGPSAFDFSENQAEHRWEDDADQGYDLPADVLLAQQEHDVFDAVDKGEFAHHDLMPASYADAPAQGRSGISTESSAMPTPPLNADAEGANHDEDGEEISDDSLTIGRSRTNGIVLDDMLVSRRHVVITADDEGLLLRDLDSRNGTFVNGRKVEQTHLREGDRIGIGASTFEVRDGWLVAV